MIREVEALIAFPSSVFWESFSSNLYRMLIFPCERTTRFFRAAGGHGSTVVLLHVWSRAFAPITGGL
jgi:hypothetical protein